MPERRVKRGYAVDDPFALRERQKLGGYPPWKVWKTHLLSHLKKEGLGDINSNAEPLLHDWYILRRQVQLGEIELADAQDRMREIQDGHPEVFASSTVMEAVRHINEKTQRPPKYRIRS